MSSVQPLSLQEAWRTENVPTCRPQTSSEAETKIIGQRASGQEQLAACFYARLTSRLLVGAWCRLGAGAIYGEGLGVILPTQGP